MTKQEFKHCFDQYFNAIRKYLYYRSGDAELASDITQDVFLRLWEKHLAFEQKGIKSLLYKMASDAFVSYVRKQAIKHKHKDAVKLSFELNNDSDPQLWDDRKIAYTKALNQLGEPHRSTLLMNKMEGLTQREIASRLGLSVKAVEKRIAKSIQLLKRQLNLHK